MMDNYIDIVFAKDLDFATGDFVEVENASGQSISAGEWLLPREDGFSVLRIRPEVFERR